MNPRFRRVAAAVLPVALLGLAALAGASALPAPVRAQAPPRAYRLYLPAAFAPPAHAPVTFSAPHGFYDAPFDLALTTAVHGATIHYTLDGSLPTVDRGVVYTGPLPIAATSIVRAAAFRDGSAVSEIATRSFLFPADVFGQSTEAIEARGFPKEWGFYPDDWNLSGKSVPADYGMHPDILQAYGGALRDSLLSLPTVSLVAPPEDLFGPNGLYSLPLTLGLERAVSAELLLADGAPGFQIDCGARIAGGWGRMADVQRKYSFSLRFRSRYGTPRLVYPLFPDSTVASFDVLRLRASQADSFYYHADKGQYLHDQWGRDTQRDMGYLSANGRFVHLYLNGLYWGLYNVSEEPTASFTSDHVGGDEDDWDVIKDGVLVDGQWTTEVEDGNDVAFEALRQVLAESPLPDPANPADRERFTRVAGLVDLAQHADYTLLQIYGANTDWPKKNFRMARDRVVADRFQTFIWDYEHLTALHDDPARGFCVPASRDPITGECGYNAGTAGVLGLHGWLSRFPEYRLLFADRAMRHLLANGVLAPDAAAARYRVRADEIERAIVAESGRWARPEPQPRVEVEQRRVWRDDYWHRYGRVPPNQAMWQAERDRLLTDYFPLRAGTVLGQLCRVGLVPSVAVPVATAERDPKGRFAAVVIEAGPDGCPGAARDGAIYFTTDGSDPRAPWSGAIAAGARRYTDPVAVSGYAYVKARILAETPAGPAWSPAAEIAVGTPRLAFSEIMYRPAGGKDEEFLEIHNLERASADLAGAAIEGAVRFTFPAGTIVPPDGHVVVAADASTFRARYGDVPLAGIFDGNLNNGGETVVLIGRDGSTLAEVPYDNEGDWPLAPGRWGYSLVPRDPGVDPADPDAWRSSADPGGSPGRPDPSPGYGAGRVVINEVLANPAPLQEAAIELFNPSDAPVELSGWSLSDEVDVVGKYLFPPNSVVGPGEYLVVFESEFGTGPGGGFNLPPDGGTVFLASLNAEGGTTGSLRGEAYGAAEAGVSFGRHRTAGGVAFVALERPTFGVDEPPSLEAFRQGRGAPNALPRVGPVVLNELDYAPTDGRDAYIELHNRTDTPLDLGDPSGGDRGWSIDGGVGYAFPGDARIGARGYVIVAAVAPAVFRSRQLVPADVPVYGPYSGRLDPGGELLELSRPWSGDPGPDAPRVVEDRVDYKAVWPWPPAARGTGASLERLDPARYGSDPENWTALSAGGTPGRPNVVRHTAYLPVTYRSY